MHIYYGDDREVSEGKFQLNFSIDQKKSEEIEGEPGFRILMTDRHDWETADIIKAYYGQSGNVLKRERQSWEWIITRYGNTPGGIIIC